MHLCVPQYFTEFIYNFNAKRIAFKTQIENSNFSQSYKAKVFFCMVTKSFHSVIKKPNRI